MVTIIAAMDSSRGIGFKNKLPWTLQKEMIYFKSITQDNIIIMGRKTFESVGVLPKRINVVLTSNPSQFIGKDIYTFSNLEESLKYFKERCPDKKIYIIGGSQIYKEALKFSDMILITFINKKYECDVYFPYFENDFVVDHTYTINSSDTHQNQTVNYQFLKYTKKNIHPEYQYINLIHDILSNGIERKDRTGTGTISLFGRRMEFDLRKGFPLLTTKKMFTKGIFIELFWFLKGSTNNKDLLEQNVHIWDANCTKEFLEKQNLNYEENELGPIYGFQWRHFGADYSKPLEENNLGVDQISNLINNIKNDPWSRRHILSAWNVSDIKKMAIPPCHVLCQFYVTGKEGGKEGGRKENSEQTPLFLDCQLYQRSGDVGLGVPFNIASYALLTHLIAHCCDLTPRFFIHTLGDAHIYTNHVEQLNTQLGRVPFDFPKLKINTSEKDIFQIKYENLEILNYNFHPAIKMDLSA